MGTNESGWAPPSNYVEASRDTQRQLDVLYRRNRSPRARDLMGPGLAPRAVQLLDWNVDDTSFNGFFFSDVGALNSPDPAAAWIGEVFATPDGAGVMHLWEMATSTYDGAAPREYQRAFRTAAGATRGFTAWELLNPPADTAPAGVAINFTGAYASAVPGPSDGVAFTCRAGILRGSFTATAYNSVSTGIQVGLYVDTVSIGSCLLASAHAVNQHVELSTLVFAIPMYAGTHRMYARILAGTSDVNDRGSFQGSITDF